VGFINAELKAIGTGPILPERVVDTLLLARQKNPIGPNSLDALCKRYGVDIQSVANMAPCSILNCWPNVYIELIGGRQTALSLAGPETKRPLVFQGNTAVIPRPRPLASRLTDAEREAHSQLVAELGPGALWNKSGN